MDIMEQETPGPTSCLTALAGALSSDLPPPHFLSPMCRRRQLGI